MDSSDKQMKSTQGDMGSDENFSLSNGKGKGPDKSSIVLFFILLLVVVFMALVTYLKSEGIDLKNVSFQDLLENKFYLFKNSKVEISVEKFDYDYTVNPVFDTYKNNIIKCTKEGVSYLDKKGEEQIFFPVPLNEPIIKTAEHNFMLMDTKGNSVIVFEGKNKKWEKKLNGKIISGNIGWNGYVTVIIENSQGEYSYSLFNSQGVERFTSIKANKFILSSHISNSGQDVLLNTINTKGLRASNYLEVDNMKGENKSLSEISKDEIYFYVSYMENDIVTVSDSTVGLYSEDMKEKWKKSLGKTAKGAVVLDNKYIAIPSSKEGIGSSSQNTLMIYDNKGELLSQYKVNEEIKGVDAYNDVVLVYGGRNLYFINTRGVLIGKYASGEIIQEAKLFNRTNAMAITKTKVLTVEIK